MSPEDADDLRGRVCGILRRVQVPKSNPTKDQRTVLKELKGLEDEVTLPAEKGNTTVMRRRCDYDRRWRRCWGWAALGS